MLVVANKADLEKNRQVRDQFIFAVFFVKELFFTFSGVATRMREYGQAA